MLDKIKIAIVCDWLTVFAGAERVVLEMHQLFPDAPIYTSVYNKNGCKVFAEADVRESFLKWIPGARSFHRVLLPLMPLAFETMNLDEYDLVISSSHSAAKGIVTRPETLHVSYCHSPMRYVWDQSHGYQNQFSSFSPLGFVYRPLLHRIRMWDRLAAERVDQFLVNSAYVGERVKKYYGRTSTVIAPPVDLSYFTPGKEERKGYIAVGRLIPYKRFELVVETFNILKKPLTIVGEGPFEKKLRKMAGPHIHFAGRVTDEELRGYYRGAKALIFPQMEDFGIVPLEAMASGTPVLAYGRGGALETVESGVSGLFFDEQTPDSLADAVQRFESRDWDEKEVSASVERFSSARFKSELRHYLETAWKEHQDMLA
jgi:glycosyltransferase involved in cell wall biosynthesis